MKGADTIGAGTLFLFKPKLERKYQFKPKEISYGRFARR